MKKLVLIFILILPTLVFSGTQRKWNSNGQYVYEGGVFVDSLFVTDSLNVNGELVFNSDGSLLAKGAHGTGSLPGGNFVGSRMVWYPGKSAFRVGYESSANWYDANIGDYSIALGSGLASGENTLAAGGGLATGDNAVGLAGGNAGGNASFAVGSGASTAGTGSIGIGGAANGTGAIALGGSATGSAAVSIGSNFANVGGSLAAGAFSVSNGINGVAIGLHCYNQVQSGFAIGYAIENSSTGVMALGSGVSSGTRLNVTSGIGIGANSTVPTLQITPASGAGTYGDVGIATITPSAKLHVAGDVIIDSTLTITDPSGADSLIVYDDGDTTRFESDNPIKIGTGSLIVNTDGSVEVDQLKVKSGNIVNIVDVDDSDYLVTNEDYIINVSNVTAQRTISLPTPDGENRIFIVKDKSGLSCMYPILVDPVGSVSVDGVISLLIDKAYGSYTFVSDGSDYFVDGGVPNDGQVKLNTGNSVRPSITITAGNVGEWQRIEYEYPLSFSSFPTSRWPKNISSDVITDSLFFSETDTTFVENLVCGQTQDWRLILDYSGKSSGSTTGLFVKLYNQLSGFELSDTRFLPNEGTSGSITIIFQTIADTVSLPSPFGTGRGYNIDVTADDPITITVDSVTRFSRATN